jgi:hypothetical protein
MINLDNYKYAGTLNIYGDKIDIIPPALLEVIHEFLDGIDLGQADADNKHGHHYIITSEEFKGLGAVVSPDKIVVICRMKSYNENGDELEDKIVTVGISRNMNGEIIKNNIPITIQ